MLPAENFGTVAAGMVTFWLGFLGFTPCRSLRCCVVNFPKPVKLTSPPERSVSVTVSSDPHLFHRPQTLTAISTRLLRFRILPTQVRTVRVPLRPVPERRCVADFTVSPVAVPGKGDTRLLGLHFDRFLYSP